MKLFAILMIAACAAPAMAQAPQEKAEIRISNNRTDPITMRFSYAFRNYTWKLIEHSVSPLDEITYRYPSNIPGCEKLHEWGIADGLLVIEGKAGMICQKRVSLCDKAAMAMDVPASGTCTWRQSP